MFGLMMDYPLTLDRIVERANRLFPHKRVRTKQLDGSLHDYTYAELYRRSRKLASVLAGLGIESADRFGTFAWNHYQRLERHFGIPGAGAVCHPIHVRLFPGQLAYIVNHAEDRLVFVDASVLPLYEKVARETSGVEC